MKLLGLIGHPLTHSFSEEYFKDKFLKLEIDDFEYRLIDLHEISDVKKLPIRYPGLIGLNVTVPYKEKIIQFLEEIDETAEEIGAVNTITIRNKVWKGYNTDYLGFRDSLHSLISDRLGISALILGSGGSSKAVQKALNDIGIKFQVVSRKKGKGITTYDEIKTNELLSVNKLIINTTPLGMHPETSELPDLAYDQLNSSHILFDLIYNPSKTSFLNEGEKRGAQINNGLEMLYIQAERAWEIWTSN